MELYFAHLNYVEKALLLAVAASAALLAGAHIFEWAGYAPCELCLDQREAHWAALAIAAPGLAAARLMNARLAAVGAVGAVALVYAVSAGLAFYHTGVEWEFWQGPSSCAADLGTAFPADGAVDLQAELADKPKGPSCVFAAWRFLGLSMAGYNLLASAGLFVACLAAALYATRRERAAVHGGAHG